MISIKQQAVSGVVWSAVERFSSLAIQMICTLVIAQFLTPADFGVFGMLTFFTAISQCLVDSGFRTALIRKNDAQDVDYSSVFYFNILFSIVLYLVLFSLASPISVFYDTPILEDDCKYSFLVIPISSIGLIQGTILTKKLKFKTITSATIIAASVSGIAGIAWAYVFRNLWALVFQNLLYYTLQTLLLWIITNWRPVFKFSILSIKNLFSFSFNMMLGTLIATICNNVYLLVIGKLYTPTALGNYTQAQKLQSIPSSSITEVIQRVSYPVLVKFQEDDEMLKYAYKKMIGLTFFVVSNIMFLLMGVSTPLFNILFSEEWNMAGRFFAILCFNGVFYPLHSINLNILTVKGKSKEFLYLEVSRRCILMLIIAISAFGTIEVFVWGQVAYSIIVLVLNLTVCGRYIQYSLLEQVKDLLPSFLLGLFTMSIIKFVIPIFIVNTWLLICGQLFVGSIIILSIAYITNNCFYKELIQIVRQKLER